MTIMTVMSEVEDLLDSVPDQDPDLRSEGQIRYMDSLITDLAELDAELGRQAREYTYGMTQRGLWTPGREGNASAWIDRLISKLKEVRAARGPVPPVTLPEVPDGRYAVEFEGEIRCYHLETGKDGTRWAGFRFLNRRSSDDLFPIKNASVKAQILALIAANLEAAEVLYARTVRECRRCHRGLTDTKNPYFEAGFGPECGAK